MPTFSSPLAYRTDIAAACREVVGEAGAALTDAEAVTKVLNDYLCDLVCRYRQRRIGQSRVVMDVAAAQQAAQEAAELAQKVRKEAEASDLAAVRTAFGVS